MDQGKEREWERKGKKKKGRERERVGDVKESVVLNKHEQYIVINKLMSHNSTNK